MVNLQRTFFNQVLKLGGVECGSVNCSSALRSLQRIEKIRN